MPNSEMFPVFDPITEKFQCYKSRQVVHADGDWHRGVHANILRPNSMGTFDLLIQKRSTAVDIGSLKYDQSLATQMLGVDSLDEELTLRRGLREELNIQKLDAYYKVPAKLRVIKTYKEYPDVLNREIMSLYLVKMDAQKQINAVTPKIESLFWIEWHAFSKFFRDNAKDFTKNAQFYFSDGRMSKLVEDAMYAFVHGTEPQSSKKLEALHVNHESGKPQTFYGDISKILKEGEAAKLGSADRLTS